MKQADINRLKRAAKHLDAALVYLNKVYEHTESWQSYRIKQHIKAINFEAITLDLFVDLMQKEPNYIHKDWR